MNLLLIIAGYAVLGYFFATWNRLFIAKRSVKVFRALYPTGLYTYDAADVFLFIICLCFWPLMFPIMRLMFWEATQ